MDTAAIEAFREQVRVTLEAHADPAWVRAYVASRGHRLSALSTREALKHLGPLCSG